MSRVSAMRSRSWRAPAGDPQRRAPRPAPLRRPLAIAGGGSAALLAAVEVLLRMGARP